MHITGDQQQAAAKEEILLILLCTQNYFANTTCSEIATTAGEGTVQYKAVGDTKSRVTIRLEQRIGYTNTYLKNATNDNDKYNGILVPVTPESNELQLLIIVP